MSTYDKKFRYITVTRAERPKGNARRIRIGEDLLAADALEYLAEFPVLNQGYAEDDWAWLVKWKEKLYILHTNGSMPVVTKDVEGFLKELQDRYTAALVTVKATQEVAGYVQTLPLSAELKAELDELREEEDT